MVKTYCDLCGELIAYHEDARLFKVKERKALFWDLYWENIIVHDRCVSELMRAIRKEDK